MTPAAVSLFLEPFKRGPHTIYEKLPIPLHFRLNIHIDELGPAYV
jgi:hypothetical protein